MLTLHLTLDNGQVTVRTNELQSHAFSIRDLDNADLKNFVNDPKPYGWKLFQALFKDGSEARKVFDDLSKQTERMIVLVLESSELDRIAWEYVYHTNAYVVEDFAFIRALPEKERPHANGRLNKSVERVPLLFIPANPLVDLSGEPMRELDIESEWREMTQHIVRSNAPFDLIELRPATPAALQSVMARFQNGMIAHFSGHGAATKDGAFLLFENENGSSNPLEAREFVREVKDQAWIGFLSACQSAVAERTEYSNLARELVKAGVPFALGMQFNLPDPFADDISGQFYNYLSQGHTVPEAARQARRAVKRENEFYVGMISLYAAHPDEAGKMEWTGSGARTVSTFAAADVSDLPTPSGFIGRQRELMNIGTSLLGKKKPNTVTLHGTGGIGKTALMRQALLRFAPSFEAALAIALDPLPSLESVLGRLERFLDLPSPCSNDTKERERIVRERLASKRMLLGLDNFETLNYALNEKDSDEEKTAKSLHSFFKYLAANGVTLCVTSREVTNLGGELVIDLEGLPNDVGGRLFQDNVIKPKQKEEIYIEKTQQVSEMVGGHPLALRLLASAFDDQVGTSLDQYIENLQSFLPKARDIWTKEDRHESLRASFDFTMRNLVRMEEGEELQVALSRLSVFVSFFAPIFAASVIGNKWHVTEDEHEEQNKKAIKICHTLWERGLLERTALPFEELDYYLYRIHPALILFAKEYLIDIESIYNAYTKTVSNFAHIADEQKNTNPVITQIALRAVPDFLNLAKLENTNKEEAAELHLLIGKLLQQFGFYDDSLIQLKKSCVLSNSFSDERGKSIALGQIARIFVARGDLEKGLELQKENLKVWNNIGDQRGVSIVLNDMAGIYVTRGEIDIAMRLYQQSLDIKESRGDLQGKAVTIDEMANIYFLHGNLDRAMNMYQQSLDIAEKLGDLMGKSVNLHNMAYVYLTRGDLNGALNLYKQSLNIKDGLGDLQGKSATLQQMAGVYVESGDLNKGMEFYKESLEIDEKLGDLLGVSVNLNNMAEIYVADDSLDEAMILYKRSLEISEQLGNIQGKSANLHNIAEIYVIKGELDIAMKLYQQSLLIEEKLGNLKGTSSTLAMMAQIDALQKNYEESLRKLLKAFDIAIYTDSSLDIQSIGDFIRVLQSVMGLEEFEILWEKITEQSLPEWLS